MHRILLLRREGATFRSIVDQLNTDRIPTPGGRSRWWPSHLSQLLRTNTAKRMAASL